MVPSRLWNVYTDEMQEGFLSFAIETKETFPLVAKRPLPSWHCPAYLGIAVLGERNSIALTRVLELILFLIRRHVPPT